MSIMSQPSRRDSGMYGGTESLTAVQRLCSSYSISQLSILRFTTWLWFRSFFCAWKVLFNTKDALKQDNSKKKSAKLSNICRKTNAFFIFTAVWLLMHKLCSSKMPEVKECSNSISWGYVRCQQFMFQCFINTLIQLLLSLNRLIRSMRDAHSVISVYLRFGVISKLPCKVAFCLSQNFESRANWHYD